MMKNLRNRASFAMACSSIEIVSFAWLSGVFGLMVGCSTASIRNSDSRESASIRKPPLAMIQVAAPTEPDTADGLYRAGTELIKSDRDDEQERGVAWLTKAAEQGHVNAQMVLGIWYGAEDGGRDAKKSLFWYRKAAEQGHHQGQWEVGKALYLSGDKEKQKEAMPWLTKAADGGYKTAYAVLGKCYAEGIGVETNIEKAVSWNMKGADLDVIGCMIWLSMHDPDKTKRHGWLLKGAGLGDAACQYLAGLNYEIGKDVAKDSGEAYKWYEKAAEKGYKDAKMKCWWKSVTKAWEANDRVEAAKWLRKMVEAGDDDPRHWIMLASCEFDQNHFAEASNLYLKAAEKGDSSAQYMTGLCFKEGLGVGKNEIVSAFWFEKAAEQGDVDAQCEIGVCYNFGNGVKRDFAKAFHWFVKAAEQGSAEGCRRLARCYEYGFGTAKDLDKAAAWYTKAADMGDENAIEWLKRQQGALANAQTAAEAANALAANAKSLEEKAKSKAGETFVVGGFYIGMPVREAAVLLRHYFPEMKIGWSLKTMNILGNKQEMMSDGIWLGDDEQCFCRTDKNGKVTRLNFHGEILTYFFDYGDLSPDRWAKKFIDENGGETFPDEIMKYEVKNGTGISVEQPVWRISLKAGCKITFFGQDKGQLDEEGDLGMLNYLHFYLIRYVNDEGGKPGTLRIE